MVQVLRSGARGERVDVLLAGEDRRARVVGLVLVGGHRVALGHDVDRGVAVLLDPRQRVEPGVHDALHELWTVTHHIGLEHEVVRDGAGELGGRGDRAAARALKRLRGERSERADGIDPAGGERGDSRIGRHRNQLDVLRRHFRLGEGEQQQVVIDRTFFDRDLLAPQITDARDALPGDDLVVAGRVVVHQHDGLLGATAHRHQGVVESLTVRVDRAGRQRVEAVGVDVEPLQFDLDVVLREQVLFLCDLPDVPAWPGRETDGDLAACRRVGAAAGGKACHTEHSDGTQDRGE